MILQIKLNLINKGKNSLSISNNTSSEGWAIVASPSNKHNPNQEISTLNPRSKQTHMNKNA